AVLEVPVNARLLDRHRSGTAAGSHLLLSPTRRPSALKLATPLTAATLVGPPSVLPPGLLPSATVTVPVKPGTGFPAASSAVTWTAGLIAAPATVLDGWTVKASRVAVPGMTSNAVLVAEVKPLTLAVSVYPVPVLLRLKSTNVATPFTAATGVVPLSALPPGLLPSATVTLPVKLGTGFPAGSSAVTWTAGLIAAPASVFDGWTVKASWVAVPGVMSNGVLVTRVNPLALAVSV